MSGGSSDFKSNSAIVNWIEYRLPVFSFLDGQLNKYPTPKNLNYFWNFGSLAGIVLVIMIVLGHYACNELCCDNRCRIYLG